MKVCGVLLIGLGLFALSDARGLYGRDHGTGLPAPANHPIPASPIAGELALAAGVVLVLSSRTRTT